MKYKNLLMVVAFLITISKVDAQDLAQEQTHGMSSSYTWPKEPEVLESLDKWQDLKFGMIIHYGLYSQLGIAESWTLCSEEEDWIRREPKMPYEEYKRWYWNTINDFKPEKLDPETWAKYGKIAGMKYVIFTTKHHDGFCMFDTKQTDFSITKGPFKNHPRSNVAKEVFNAFRNEGYMIGAYFSKPDWHSQYYWWDEYATPTRNNNYDIRKHPERWEKFKEFTYNQIQEIVSGDYGKIDMLWLDGGQVQPWTDAYGKDLMGRYYKGSQDIDMPKIAAMVRSYNPAMLVVDRTVAGPYENYQTPEQGVPGRQLANPWESCITLGNGWGYIPNENFKPAAAIIHTLAEIVAKGGSLVLGIGPKPDGTISDEVKERLEDIGRWMSKNGEAIYNTRITPVYNDGSTWFTQSKDCKTIYAINCLEQGKPIPAKIVWQGNEPAKGTKMIFIQTGKPVKWSKTDNGIEVVVPKGLPANQPALAFSFGKAGK